MLEPMTMGVESQPTRVLVIDDSRLVAAILEDDLTASGHVVKAAIDGRRGLALAAEWSPHVVLCDLQMPGVSGFEVVEELKRSTPRTPVLIFTDTSDLKSAVEAMQRGAWGYLVKGLSAAALNGEVLKALAHRKVMERNHELELASLRHQEELEQLVEAKTKQIARLETARAQADRLAAMGSFVAGIAHEVNNPLSVIKANISYLGTELPAALRDEALAAEVAEALSEIRTCTGRIQRIVEGLKRSSWDGVTSELAELEPALAEVRLLVRERVPAALALRWAVDPDVHTLAIPRGDLVLVLSNLIINAAHAVEPNAETGRVTVRVWRDQGFVKLEVADNGPGIPAEQQGRIFDTFFTTKPPGKGSGLGLSLVRQVVQNAGGTVEVHSRLGAGATFLVSVPAELGTAASTSPLARR